MLYMLSYLFCAQPDKIRKLKYIDLKKNEYLF
ncbi:hypothetical protein DespoDRAFT_01599 [Desulfobacter postgatei 2ac9]|uniref:Uncharacterized protein n=1 Tax=Desulfobacter postgatei 2ac9 TaxID=879212 RepID=I5B214_9BACT|nr:hypothetical protein DespoDRAFT_01599 [Desulfobacter postgatei 2ac9]